MFVSLIGYLVFFNFHSDKVQNSPYNRRQDSQSTYVRRGDILDSKNNVLATTQVDANGKEIRVYPYSNMFSHSVGYSTNGKSGVESIMNYDLLTSHDNFLDRIVNEFKGVKNEVEANVLTFVPNEDTCELSQVKLTNKSSQTKQIKLFSYVEWCLWNADDDSRNFQRNFSTGEVEVIDSTIYHKTEYRERRNHYAVYSVNTKIDGFDTSRDAFLGAYHDNHDPEVVCEKGECTGSIAHGWSPVAVHQINVTLNPGETKSFVFVLGYCENPQDEKWESKGIINKAPAKKLLSSAAGLLPSAAAAVCRSRRRGAVPVFRLLLPGGIRSPEGPAGRPILPPAGG